MASSAREKFDAAVKVIKSLPKNGSFQPSHELMLKFYAYYKQATLGPCNIPKPGFWDMVGKAKWDAWNNLGPMGKEEAMVNYVDELKQIIETMPQTEMVADFIEKLGSFYELVDEKQEAAIRAKREKEDLAKSLESKIKMNGDVVKDDEQNPLVMMDSDKDIDTKAEPEEGDASADQVNNNQTEHLEELIKLAHDNLNDIDPEMNNPLTNDTSTQVIMVKPKITSTPQKPRRKDLEGRGNGHDRDIRRRINGHVSPRSLASDTDSDVDEFCDTSDQLQMPNLIPARIPDRVANMDSSTQSTVPPGGSTIQTSADIHHPRLTDRPDGTLESVNLTNSQSLTLRESEVLSVSHSSAIYDQFLSHNPESSHPSLQSDMLMMRGGGDNSSAAGTGHSVSTTMSNPSVAGNPGHQPPAQGSPPLRSQSVPIGGAGGSGGSSPEQQNTGYNDVNEQIAVALIRLQQDMNQVLTRLNTLETHAILQRQLREVEETRRERSLPPWWPFGNLQGRTIMFILVWPVVLNWIIKLLFRRRK